MLLFTSIANKRLRFAVVVVLYEFSFKIKVYFTVRPSFALIFFPTRLMLIAFDELLFTKMRAQIYLIVILEYKQHWASNLVGAPRMLDGDRLSGRPANSKNNNNIGVCIRYFYPKCILEHINK